MLLGLPFCHARSGMKFADLIGESDDLSWEGRMDSGDSGDGREKTNHKAVHWVWTCV